jgi:hypothetical protein
VEQWWKVTDWRKQNYLQKKAEAAKNMDAAKDIHKEMLPIWTTFLCGYPLLHPYFLPQKTHNATLFYRGTCIQEPRHLVTVVTSLQSCAYRSLCVTIKVDSAAN